MPDSDSVKVLVQQILEFRRQEFGLQTAALPLGIDPGTLPAVMSLVAAAYELGIQQGSRETAPKAKPERAVPKAPPQPKPKAAAPKQQPQTGLSERLLAALQDFDGPFEIHQIAKKLGVPTNQVMKVIYALQDLERKGIVEPLGLSRWVKVDRKAG